MYEKQFIFQNQVVVQISFGFLFKNIHPLFPSLA